MVLSMSCEPLSRSNAGIRVWTTRARRWLIRGRPPRRRGRAGSRQSPSPSSLGRGGRRSSTRCQREATRGVEGSPPSPATRTAATVGWYTTAPPVAQTSAHHSRSERARPLDARGQRDRRPQRAPDAASSPAPSRRGGRTRATAPGRRASPRRSARRIGRRTRSPPADSSRPSRSQHLAGDGAVGRVGRPARRRPRARRGAGRTSARRRRATSSVATSGRSRRVEIGERAARRPRRRPDPSGSSAQRASPLGGAQTMHAPWRRDRRTVVGRLAPLDVVTHRPGAGARRDRRPGHRCTRPGRASGRRFGSVDHDDVDAVVEVGEVRRPRGAERRGVGQLVAEVELGPVEDGRGLGRPRGEPSHLGRGATGASGPAGASRSNTMPAPALVGDGAVGARRRGRAARSAGGTSPASPRGRPGGRWPGVAQGLEVGDVREVVGQRPAARDRGNGVAGRAPRRAAPPAGRRARRPATAPSPGHAAAHQSP